jgi:uncharacterized protein (DUF433 family)
MQIDYKNFISVNPEIRFGKPCLTGTRISVYDVLGWLASGMSNDEIIEDYPDVTKDMIYACLAYAAEKERKLKVA